MRKVAISMGVVLSSVLIAPPVVGQQEQVPANIQKMAVTFAAVETFLQQNRLDITDNPKEAFMNGYILVMGEGLPSPTARTPSQKRLTAERAATVQAYRALAEMLDGVAVVGDTVVKDMALQYDVVRAAVAGFVRGAQVVYKHWDEKDEVAVVLVKVGMDGPQGFASLMYQQFLGNQSIKNQTVKEVPQMKARPVPVAENFDGLIVDATGLNFRPALMNRIFNTKGEAVYDPSKISMQVLNEFGCGEYTDSVEKARDVLAKRGVKNPLVVKATGTLSLTDLVLSDEDAIRVFSANQKSGFLNSAKVAFVLK
ncbi:MAG: hypothetical protein NZ526_06160 [Aquificaceae bacterium]|nr:hypothetical protein [Aquificaceae bacterium]